MAKMTKTEAELLLVAAVLADGIDGIMAALETANPTVARIVDARYAKKMEWAADTVERIATAMEADDGSEPGQPADVGTGTHGTN